MKYLALFETLKFRLTNLLEQKFEWIAYIGDISGLIWIISVFAKFFEKLVVERLLEMPSSGLEPETSPLPRECSTAELQGQFKSGPGWI